MDAPSYLSLSRQMALSRQLEVIANNIANATTTAFKGEKVLFREMISHADPNQPISFVEEASVVADMSTGPMRNTGGALDVALDGDGFLTVEAPAGLRYTRDGALKLSEEREIVTREGWPVLADNGQAIRIPPGTRSIDISNDGVVRADNAELGRLAIAAFDMPGMLMRTASGYWKTDLEPEQAEEVRVQQGMLEDSNIQPVIEMTRMVELLRAYQSNQKIIEAEQERLTRAIRELPRATAA